MDSSAKRHEPVRNRDFSTAGPTAGNGVVEPCGSVFPVVHTPYDFYERI